MNLLRNLGLAVADRANPVVVKELRQAVQSRLVSAILILFLMVNLLIVGGFLMLNEDSVSNEMAGQRLFSILYFVLVVTCMVFVPLYAGVRLAMERNDVNIDLLFVTTISPAAIIRGKFLAAVALTILIYCACMPFLAFTYLLRGIDLPSIFAALAAGVICTAGVIMVTILVGSFAGGWLLRILLAGGTLFLLGYAVAGTIVLGYQIIENGIGAMFDVPEAWFVWTIGTLAYLAAWGLCYLLAVAALSARSSNRMFPVRVYLTLSWLIIGVIVAFWADINSTMEALIIWADISAGVFCVVMVVIFAERESWTPRVRRRIPRLAPLRFVAWLFYTGSAGGALWCAAMIAASLAIGWWAFAGSYSMSSYLHQDFQFSLELMSGMALFTWCYLMTGLLIRRVLVPWSPTLVTPVIALSLFVAGCLLPPVTGFMTDGLRSRIEELPVVFLLFSPAIFSDNLTMHRVTGFVFLIFWAGLGAMLNLPWFFGQWRAFVRYQRVLEVPVDAVLVEAPVAHG